MTMIQFSSHEGNCDFRVQGEVSCSSESGTEIEAADSGYSFWQAHCRSRSAFALASDGMDREHVDESPLVASVPTFHRDQASTERWSGASLLCSSKEDVGVVGSGGNPKQEQDPRRAPCFGSRTIAPGVATKLTILPERGMPSHRGQMT